MGAEIIFGFMCLAAIGALYFLPTIVSYINKKENKDSIFIVNLFLGWTFIGWVVALAWAASKK